MKSPYSIGAQLALLIASILAGLLTSSILSGIAISLLGIPIESISMNDPKIYLISGFFSQLIGFIGGFIIFLKITQQSFIPLIQIRKPEFKMAVIVIGILIISIPVISVLGYYNSFLKDLIPNNTFILQEAELKIYQSNLFATKGSLMMFSKFFIVALLPAIGEELVFRGVLLAKIKEASQNEHYGVAVSGVIFAAIHQQPTSLLPMIFLGIVLGYIYTRTKNILYPMLFHFLFNSTMIVLGYYEVEA